ncbi:unnamed protein product [Ilex paraguariensis]|uniref:Uncharacterized protein n=1 Tax=Ilex paraguariensis TaxID=185542 RepID=A0ABC8REZ6_9AQUA
MAAHFTTAADNTHTKRLFYQFSLVDVCFKLLWEFTIMFESGIDAAFALHKTDEAYLFKGDYYVRINFAPGTIDDNITGGIKKILTYWPSLRSILPLKNSA